MDKSAELSPVTQESSQQVDDINEAHVLDRKASLRKSHRYKQKSKQSKRKRESPSSSSGSSSSDSSTSDEESSGREGKRWKRFTIISESDKNKWRLPKSMVNYANTHFEEYIPNKDLKESILSFLPVPEKLDPVKKLDDFLKDLLSEKGKNYTRNWDSVLENMQRKTIDVMGPLSKVRHILEEKRRS